MIFDREASAENRWKAFYELTTGNKAARRRARKILLGIALDATEAVEVREVAHVLGMAGETRPIALLRESINDDTPSHDLWWTLAQECRWASLCCHNAERDGASNPEDAAFLSPAWEQETQFFRAKGRRLFPRNCR